MIIIIYLLVNGRAEHLRKIREEQEFKVSIKNEKELALENQKIATRGKIKNEYETKYKMGIIS